MLRFLPLAPAPRPSVQGRGPCGAERQGSWPLLLAAALFLPAAPALAQVQKYTLERGSKVGVESKVVEKNCKKATDGSGTLTCDTEVVNPKGVTKARPSYSSFDN
jgi:hypothetical protein